MLVIRGATVNPGDVPSDRGRIEVGKRADLVVLDPATYMEVVL